MILAYILYGLFVVFCVGFIMGAEFGDDVMSWLERRWRS